MNSTLDTPIYLNKNLTLDLHSILINGYIESRSVKSVEDCSNDLKVEGEFKNDNRKDEKISNNDKDNNIACSTTNNNSNKFSGSLHGKNSIKSETSTKTVYTTFQIFNDLKNSMISKGLIKNISDFDITNASFLPGDYIEFYGEISTISIQSQISTMINILETYDCKVLDDLLKNQTGYNSLTNYSIILKQFKNLNEIFNRNNTVNMILSGTSLMCVLNVNSNYFLDKSTYLYDDVGCYCKTLCKIIKFTNKNDCIDLLNKTCMSSYYNSFLEQTKPFMDLLNKNNILTPEEFLTKINGPAIQAIPIAMYI